MISLGIYDGCKEHYEDIVTKYLEQLQSEQDIALFPRCFGKYYYMYKGLVHEIRIEDDQIVDETFESWSKEEKHFVMTVLSDRVW